MNGEKSIRAVVSIAGVVQELVTKPNEKPPRIAGALVRIIIVPETPEKFQSRVSAMLDTWYANSFNIEPGGFVAELDKPQLTDALRARFEAHGKLLSRKKAGEPGEEAHIVQIEKGSTWQIVDAGKSYMIWNLNGRLAVYFDMRYPSGMAPRQLRQRVDQTRTQADGIFYSLTFRPVPIACGSAYPRWDRADGEVEVPLAPLAPLDVQESPEDGPFRVVRADVDLPPTRIHGVVTDAVRKAHTGRARPPARRHNHRKDRR